MSTSVNHDGGGFDEQTLWTAPFATPMVEDAFKWASHVVVDGGTGGFTWGPTRTGKSTMIRLLVPEMKRLRGRRGNLIESECLFMETGDRWVMAEGNFWDWQLHQLNHVRAGMNDRPQIKRHLACEFLKGVAASSRSGRVIVFVDEAQLLELHELGLFADQFNALAKDGYRMVLFLVGAYQVSEWKVDLTNPRYAHVRSRFFTHEHRLRGLSRLEDYARCLNRYDVDHCPWGGTQTITEYLHPDWFHSGERLQKYASRFKAAFSAAIGNPMSFHVPMAFFSAVVQGVLDRPQIRLDPRNLERLVKECGFALNYERDPPPNSAEVK